MAHMSSIIYNHAKNIFDEFLNTLVFVFVEIRFSILLKLRHVDTSGQCQLFSEIEAFSLSSMKLHVCIRNERKIWKNFTVHSAGHL